MLLPFICIFIGAFICFFLGFYMYHSHRNADWGLHIAFTIIVGGIVGMIIWLFAANKLENDVIEKVYKYKEYPIVSLKNDGAIYGDFFLGCGTINETEYYYYFKQNSNGRLEREQIVTWRVEIEETNTKKPCIAIPYLVQYVRKSEYKHPKLWFINTEDETKVCSGETYSRKRILYVPKGTIITNFKLY